MACPKVSFIHLAYSIALNYIYNEQLLLIVLVSFANRSFLFSVPRSSSGSTGTNNLPPLLFHQVHGENIRVSRDGSVARRAESFCKGVTFTNRPVKISEKVSIFTSKSCASEKLNSATECLTYLTNTINFCRKKTKIVMYF